MPNYLDRVRSRLNDSLDLFSERGIDIAAGRRDKLGRKTQRWYAEAEALRELKEESRENESKYYGHTEGEASHRLRRETRKIKKRVRAVEDEEKKSNVHHRKQKEIKMDKTDKITGATRVRENDTDTKGPNFQENKEVDRSSNGGIAINAEDLNNYEQTTEKLKERLAAIEGKAPLLNGEPFPQNDMQAAADILVLEDIKTALDGLKNPGPPKPPKIPLDSVSGLRGGGGRLYEKRSSRKYENYDEENSSNHVRNDDEDEDNNNNQNNKARKNKYRQGEPKNSHVHHDRFKERHNHRRTYLSPNRVGGRRKVHFAPGTFFATDDSRDHLRGRKHGNLHADNHNSGSRSRHDIHKAYLAGDSPTPSRTASFFAPHHTNGRSPTPIFVDHPRTYGKYPKSAFVNDRQARDERQNPRPSFFSNGKPHFTRQGPIPDYTSTKKSPSSGYFAANVFSDDDDESDIEHRPTSSSRQKQRSNEYEYPWRSESPSPKPSRSRSERKTDDNNARQNRNRRKPFQRSTSPSPRPSTRYSEKKRHHGGRDRPIFNETGSSSDISSDSSSDSYQSHKFYYDEDEDEDEDISDNGKSEDQPPDHYATLGINARCTNQEFVSSFPILVY